MRSVLSASLPEKMALELDAFARATGRNKSDIVEGGIGHQCFDCRLLKIVV